MDLDDFDFWSKDGFIGNDSHPSMNARPYWVVLCVRNANKNCRLDKLSKSFSDIFHNSFT